MVLLKKLVKYISLFFAACIIIAAIVVCLSRFITPILVQHRADFERLASDLVHSPVTVSSVHASWYHYEPELSLNNVTILDATTKKPAMHIERLSVFISLPQSIWHWKFIVDGVLVSGSSIDIEKDASGKFVVQGIKGLADDSPNRMNVWALLAWLTQEQRIILQDIDLHYTDVKHESRFVSLYDLQITNNGTAHTINGIATLHQKLPTKMKMAIEWDGQDFDPEKITAKGYFYLSGLDLSQWLHSYSWRGWQIKQGIASSKIWLNWDNGAMQKVQVLAQSYGLELFSQTDNTSHSINRFSGSFGWKRNGKTQIFAGEDILIDFPNSLWPVSSFYISLQPDANNILQPQLIKIGYLNLPDVYRFMTAEQREWVTKIALTGVLQNLSITFPNTWTEWAQLGLNSSFNQVHFLPWGNVPGLTNLSGQLKWDGAQGIVNLNSQQSVLSLQEYFANDIPLQQITGSVQIQRDKNAWRVTTPKLQISNDDISAVVSGDVVAAAETSPILNLKSDFSLAHAEKVSQYLPVKTFDKDFTIWLQTAFSTGEVQNGHAEISGTWEKFPYDKGDGVFKISADVKDVTLKYAPDWPLLSNIDGKLNFDADKVTVAVSQAELADSKVTQINAEIPSMMADKVIINIHAPDLAMGFSNAVDFIHKSPLDAYIGEIFKGKDFKGNIKLNLQLKVPLANPEKTSVQGILSMQDNEMDLLRTGLTIDHLQGNIAFTEDSVAANQVTATLFDKPINFNLSTLIGKNESPIQAQFTTNIAVSDLEKWLQVPFSKVLQGATDVTGTLLLSLHKGLSLNITSNLVGVSVTLPEKYGKEAKDARSFSLQLTAQEPQPLKLSLNYNKLLSAALVLSPKEQGYSLTAVDLHIGNGTAAFPETPGLYMMGSFDELDFSQLQKYWLDSSPQTFALPDNLVLRNIELSAKTFKIGNLILEDLSGMITPEKTDWLIALNSPDLDGQLRIPRNFNADNTIEAEFSRLNITPSDAIESETSFNIKNFPAVNFSCKDTSYNGKSFGQVDLITEPTAAGMIIKSINITSQLMDLNATGSWHQTNNTSSTQLQGTLQSSQAGGLLKNFGVDANNFVVESGTVDFNLNWNDAPYKFSLVNANGTMRLKLGKGRIVDIGQQNGATMDLGRMLSIFSLQTIPRRLSLDFSDVVMKGYSFDKVTGDLNLRGGSIYTTNFKFNGPVAMVGINGRIGLKDKDYDFTLIITPYVTSSVPVAAALLTMQPLVGLAAFAVNSVIGPSLNKATTYYYVVTGTWQNPVWKEISMNRSGRRLGV